MNNDLRIKNKANNKGFTLIELLIVIGIIGILSSFLLANFIGVRQRARDGLRKSDLRQIQLAVESYRADQSLYPDTGQVPNDASGDPVCATSLLSNPTDCSSTIYMKKVPADPLGGTYYYSSPDGGFTYSIIACLENDKDLQADSTPDGNCASTTNISYTLYSP
jgi:general secretion pathway protein G